ncbi:MAG: ArsR/SmtB family transcription factor [Solirubrobacterales bacterium]
MPKTKDKNDVEQIVAKAFAHPLRVQILIILNERVASPNLLAQELDQSLNLVAYHVRVLEKYDCIELVDTKQRRGATEHFYRATRRQFLSSDEWARMPDVLRPAVSGAVLQSIFGDIEEAVKSGTMNTADDFHVSRTPMIVDEQGFEDVTKLLDQTLDRLLEIQAQASERLTKGGGDGFLSKVELLHFKSPDSAEGEAEAKKAAEAAANGS